MLVGLWVEVRSGEAKVYYIDLVFLEKVFFTGLQLFGVNSKIKKEIIELEIIIDEARTVHFFEDVEHL